MTDTKLSVAAKARAARPEERDRLAQHLQGLGRSTEMRALRSANATQQWADPANRQERSDIYKKRWADPAFKEQVLAKRRATLAAKKLLRASAIDEQSS